MQGNFPDRRACLAVFGSAMPNHWRSARVLVVDDHRTYRVLLSSMLEKLGVAHHCCDDGRQALEVLVTQPFDLLITDCRMPVMDGYAMTRELRRREQASGSAALYILALSASLGPEEIRLCRACGMDGWLRKPIGYAQLREVLFCRALPPRLNVTHECAHSFPGRDSLIATFGAWDAVEPMVFSLIEEIHADLAALTRAEAALDTTLVAHTLHRLVGSIAFFGETGLEARASALIERVRLTGVALNRAELDNVRHSIERYLEYLGCL